MVCLIFFNSCQEERKTTDKVATNPISLEENPQEPNYDYKINVPIGWELRDTTIQGLRMRFILAPDSLDYEKPRVNILIAAMGGKEIDDFTTTNMNYLKANMPETVLQDRGSIKVSAINGRWFTYTREQNGIVRDMINYIIPGREFAYMITCGTNRGSMIKYRAVFDQIAQSFKDH
jgi:hypothetical protein